MQIADGAEWYYYIRDPIVNTVPLLLSVTSLFIADVIIVESDWWIHVVTSTLYLGVNYLVSDYTGVKRIYYLDWTTVSEITPFSPVFSTMGFGFIALSLHFLLCALTQYIH